MRRSQQKGAVLPFLVVALPVLIAGLGLVIDNGAMYELKRRLQTAADAHIPAVQPVWMSTPAAALAARTVVPDSTSTRAAWGWKTTSTTAGA